MNSGIITDIKQTKKGRYALFCDGEFLFSVDEDTLVRHHLKKGMTLDGEKLMQVRQASDYQKAKNKALDFLSLRDHSTFELKQKLMRTFDEPTAELAVAKVSELGLTDNCLFAKRYAEELIVRKGQSKRTTANKLREKGIDRETIDEVLAQYQSDETACIKEIIEKKYLAKLKKENGRNSVFAALMRKGFGAQDIKNALKDYSGNDNETDEEF